MTAARNRKSPKQLSKFLALILGRCPDEFGLVPDADGYVKTKELLKVFQEEEGWKYVRQGDIDAVMFTLHPPPLEIIGDRIRARDRQHLPRLQPAAGLPKLLYTCVGEKAYPHVLERGLGPSAHDWVILAAERSMAERMGGRKGSRPVVLTVHSVKSMDRGVVFQQFGAALYTAAAIPADCFSGPPLPREKPAKKAAETPTPKAVGLSAGSFILDPTPPKPGEPRKQSSDWKKQRRQQRKHKQQQEWKPS